MESLQYHIKFHPRNHAIDRAKVLCAFLVIYAHLFHHDSMVRLYIYAFHMALFFLISGMFFKLYEDLWKGVLSSFRRIVVPAFFFEAFLIIVYIPLYQYDILPHKARLFSSLFIFHYTNMISCHTRPNMGVYSAASAINFVVISSRCSTMVTCSTVSCGFSSPSSGATFSSVFSRERDF